MTEPACRRGRQRMFQKLTRASQEIESETFAAAWTAGRSREAMMR